MPTLDESVTALLTSLVERAEELMPEASPQELALLGHAISATRGTATMQAIIEMATDALGDLTTAKDTHLAALVTALGTHTATLNALATTLSSQLTTVRDSSVTAIQGVWASIGGMRIGDITWRLFPDSAALPAVLLPLIGGTKTAADYPDLVTAWGLNGGSPCEFVTRYNATNPHSINVRVEGGLLYLPKMDRMFPNGVPLADMGKYSADVLREHVHNPLGSGASYLYNNPVVGNTGSAAIGTVKTTGATTGLVKQDGDHPAPTGDHTKPESIGGLFCVRAL